jgi:hypothetical protein
VIVGSVAESKRALDLLQLAEVTKRCIGIVSPSENKMQNVQKNRIGTLSQLADIIHIYTIDEIIFCAKDVENQAILRWMSQLGAQVQYKILPEESQSIIGSSSKNTSGELYTLEVRFAIATPLNRRNKRVFDVIISVLSLAFFPIFVLLIEKKTNFIGNICAVLLGKKTWVGYAEKNNRLPKLRSGILHPSAKLNPTQQNANTRERLDFLYAKDYNIERDMQLVWQNFEKLGN